MTQRLRTHTTTLRAGVLTLRPMTERDWEPLLAWNNDAELLRLTEHRSTRGRTLPEVQALYRGVSQGARMFMIERGGAVVGECWLQRMNVPRLLAAFPGRDIRRVDLMIGVKRLWGRGIGTRVIELLCAYAFEQEGVEAVFACGVADFNTRSLGAFRRAGFREYARRRAGSEVDASWRHDLWRAR